MDAIRRLYPAAFPDEDLFPLVTALVDEGPSVLSLAFVEQGAVAGHILFTACAVEGDGGALALLGPLAVAPSAQGKGIGSALIRAGLHRLEAQGIERVFVLGDAAYYGRFGFAAEERVATPYALPEQWRGAWQSLALGGARPSPPRGSLAVPPPWRRRALWAP